MKPPPPATGNDYCSWHTGMLFHGDAQLQERKRVQPQTRVLGEAWLMGCMIMALTDGIVLATALDEGLEIADIGELQRLDIES